MIANMESDRIDHSLALLVMLKELRRNRFICDVELVIGKDLVPAHKAVLAASSDFFVKYFSSLPISDSPIEIPGIKPEALRFCLNYMYEGTAHLSIENVEDVLEASRKLKLLGLTKACSKFLLSTISIGSCLRVSKIARKSGLMPLKYTADRYSAQYFDFVIRTEAFRNLKSQDLVSYIRNLMSPDQKWEAALLWVKADFANRQFEFPEFLEIILPGCTFELVFNVMWAERPIAEMKRCRLPFADTIFQNLTASKLTLKNCFPLLEIAFTTPTDLTHKRKIIYDFIAAHYVRLSDTDGFRNLPGEDLLEILDSETCRLFTAEIKWESASAWVKSDLQCRRKYLGKIMRRIKWECSFSYFLNNVFRDFLIQHSKACRIHAAKILLRLMKEGDITRNNWFDLHQISKAHEDVFKPDCSTKILTFASVNFPLISACDYFGQISAADLMLLLQRPEVKSGCADFVKWEAAKNWINRDVEARKELLPEILDCLDLNQWSFKFLYECVFNELLINESDPCKKVVASALLRVMNSTDISTKNCYDLYMLTKHFKAEKVLYDVATIRNYFVMCFLDVAALQFFLRLDFETIEYILNSEIFQRYSPSQKWEPMYSWVCHDETRAQCIVQIVEKLQLDLFDFNFLEKRVFCQSRIQHNGYCKEQCISAMLKNMKYSDINHVNWYELLAIMKKRDDVDTELIDKVQQFMSANFTVVTQSAHFKDLTLEEVLNLLNSPEISSTTPERQIQGIMKWIRDNETANDGELVALIRGLKLEGFPFSLLYKYLLEDDLIKASPECAELFLSGMQNVLKPSFVTTKNWSVLLQTVKYYGREQYKQITHITLNFVASNFSSIRSHNGIVLLEFVDFCYVLQSPDLRCPEETKAMSIIEWVEHHEAGRWINLPDLLQNVHFHELDSRFLRHAIYDKPLIRNSDACKAMLLEALMVGNCNDSQTNSTARPRKRDRSILNGVRDNKA